MKQIDSYSWETIDLLARQLAASIKEPFDALVCVLRGGAIPGAILANELGIDLMMGMKVVQNGQMTGVAKVGMAYEAEKAQILVPLNDVSLVGKRVLVVDDVLDSGETAALVVEEVRRRGASIVKLATLQIKTYSRFKPDYFVEEISNWIYYPWMSERERGEMEKRLQASSQGS